jgi:hypothetical protein
MKISPNIEIIDLALYVNNNLILSDFHIGYEEALNKQGLLVPRFQFKEIIKRLENIFSRLKKKKIKKIVINGDIKHEFGTISEQEWRLTLRLLDYLGKYCNEIILIKGNHDTILGPIAKKRNVKVLDHYIINTSKKSTNKKSLKNKKNNKNNILIIHGNKIPNKEILNKKTKTVIIGHEHPAVSLKEGPRVELFKCFLKGKYKNKTLIVQPSFNLVTEGTDLMKEELLSPFLHQNLDNFKVFIVADKVYRFGSLMDVRKLG